MHLASRARDALTPVTLSQLCETIPTRLDASVQLFWHALKCEGSNVVATERDGLQLQHQDVGAAGVSQVS